MNNPYKLLVEQQFDGSKKYYLIVNDIQVLITDIEYLDYKSAEEKHEKLKEEIE